jgi:ribulose kinase
MSSHKHAIGLDFGAELGRAVLVDVTDDRETATAVHLYKDRIQAGP